MKSNYESKREWENRYPQRKSVPLEAVSPEVEEKTEPKTEKGVVVDCFFVNVRSAPENASSANILGQVQKGSVWDVKKEVGNYYQIEYEGRPAYISKDFMEIES